MLPCPLMHFQHSISDAPLSFLQLKLLAHILESEHHYYPYSVAFICSVMQLSKIPNALSKLLTNTKF